MRAFKFLIMIGLLLFMIPPLAFASKAVNKEDCSQICEVHHMLFAFFARAITPHPGSQFHQYDKRDWRNMMNPEQGRKHRKQRRTQRKSILSRHRESKRGILKHDFG